jgi:hypothetical protein
VTTATSFRTIRLWDGSQHRAFEELCYQLRDPTPSNAKLIKAGNPDAGVEWYLRHRNGIEWGWQAKYSFTIDDLLKEMAASLKTVCEKRPRCSRLTFCIPFDLPDGRVGKAHKSARQKFEDRKQRWAETIDGADSVTVELWSAGDLLERLNSPTKAGKAWFFWDQHIFSPEWCRERLRITTEAAGERYSPELNVTLPVAFSLEGLARTQEYWQHYRRRRAKVIRVGRDLHPNRYKGLGVTGAVRHLLPALEQWRSAVGSVFSPSAQFSRDDILTATSELAKAVEAAWPPVTSGKDRKLDETRQSLLNALSRLRSALSDFTSFLQAPASVAAARRALVMTGMAGQGKTHLFCDAGTRLIERGQPAVVVLGNRMSSRHAWAGVAQQLGLGEIGATEFLQAARAAGEAANAPFTVLIDALNEAAEPTGWQAELPGALAEISDDPWVALGISVRSSYAPFVLPDDGSFERRIAKVDHPGFADREVEALEKFFAGFQLEQPRAPLLTPEFTNPLFLKLYCEGLRDSGLSAPPPGHVRLTEVFFRFLERKERRITTALGLDPEGNAVRAAVREFADTLAAVGSERLSRSNAQEIIDRYAPNRPRYENTLFAALISEGVLIHDLAWDRTTEDYVPVVRFSYQRLTDHVVVDALLRPIADAAALRTALRSGAPLRHTLRRAPTGWIEALSIQVPERFGVELLRTTNWRLPWPERHNWMEAFVESIPLRAPETITDATRDLMNVAARSSERLDELVLESIITVAPQPDHPFNANWLHGWLTSKTLPERDAGWSQAVYSTFGERTALDRLIRWATKGPYPSYSDEVLELSCIPLIWTLTSPNRRLRDYTTKAVTYLLASRLSVLRALLERFATVNDPYVLERFAVITHGALLIANDPHQAVGIASRLKEAVLADDAIPNIITRDALRGVYEWCYRAGAISEEEYHSALPPYRSAPPGAAASEEALREKYDLDNYDDNTPEGLRARAYSAISMSLFHMGDFGRYVVESKVRQFTNYPLDEPAPAVKKRDEESFPAKQAQSWIFERVMSLGWTPELFGDFDRSISRGRYGREGHKPERFGKKYQWIALRELLARISDNFHMSIEWREPRTYEGPWQFFGRDIDPTLPPAVMRRDDDDYEQIGSTFDGDQRDEWWCPDGPEFVWGEDVPLDWATQEDTFLDLANLARRRDGNGRWWVVLHAYYNWDEDAPEEVDKYTIQRRDLWSHIYGWLVAKSDVNALTRLLATRSFINQWMPQGREVTDAAYLAEMPWAAAASEYRTQWERVEPRDDDPDIPDIDAYPASVAYLWEGNVWDCSLSESVSARLPSELLFDLGGLRWRPHTREWETEDRRAVAQYRESLGHSALLVDETWLADILRAKGWGLILGWLGEKQLIGGGWSPRLVGGWTQINGTASLLNGKWKFGPRRVEHNSVVD